MADQMAPGVVRTPPQHQLAKTPTLRETLLEFCYYVCEGEFGEGHEERIVDSYLAQHMKK